MNRLLSGVAALVSFSCVGIAIPARAVTMTYVFDAVGTGHSTGYISIVNNTTYDYVASAAQLVFVVPNATENSIATMPTGAGVATIFTKANGSGLGFVFTNSFYGLSGDGNVCFSNPGNLLPGQPVALTNGGDCGAVHFVDQGRFSRDWFDGVMTSMTVLEGDLFSFGAGAVASNILAVLEPTTWAMMLVGFGGIGYAMRRTRKVAASLG